MALAGVAASAAAATVVMTTARTTEPEWQAVLFAWIVLTYTVGGAIAWWRRPDSRFGPLMIAAGAAMFVSSLYFADSAALFTLGLAFDLIPAALFLHVFLAYPGGRLGGAAERAIVAVAYVCAVGLQVVNMTLGNYGPDNLLEVTQDPDAGLVVTRVQLTTLSACMLAGVVVLVLRRRAAGRPGRLWVALLIDSFAIALVMIAFLFCNGAWGKVAFPWIQRATLFAIGLAPVAFLLGLFQARLARASVGDLLVGLQAEPSPPELRAALARALRDPSLELAYWLPEFGATPTSTGAVAELPGRGSGARGDPDRPRGGEVAALVHDPSLGDEPAAAGAVTAAAGIAHREHAPAGRAAGPPGGAARVAGAGDRGRPEASASAWSATCTTAPSSASSRSRSSSAMLERRSRTTRRPARASSGRGGRSRPRSTSCARSRGACTRPSSAATASRSRWSSWPRARRSRCSSTSARRRAAAGAARGRGLLPRLREPGQHRQVRRGASATVAVPRAGGEVTVEVVDDGVGGADTEGGTGLRGLADRVEALDGRLRVWSPRGGGTRVRAEIPCAS